MNIKIDTDFIKLDSLLKLSGLAQTGGHAKLAIAEGYIAVNGEVCLARGKKIYPGDHVTVTAYDEENDQEEIIEIVVTQ